jgi:hypothetical protein
MSPFSDSPVARSQSTVVEELGLVLRAERADIGFFRSGREVRTDVDLGDDFFRCDGPWQRDAHYTYTRWTGFPSRSVDSKPLLSRLVEATSFHRHDSTHGCARSTLIGTSGQNDA